MRGAFTASVDRDFLGRIPLDLGRGLDALMARLNFVGCPALLEYNSGRGSRETLGLLHVHVKRHN
jgi:hypothetical protein